MKAAPDVRRAPPEPAPFWPWARFPEALREAIVRANLPTAAAAVDPLGEERGTSAQDFGRWLRYGASGVGFAGVPKNVSAPHLEASLEREGPYLVVVDTGAAAPRAVSVVRRGSDRCLVIRPDGSESRVTVERLCADIRAGTTHATAVARLFEGLPAGDRALRSLVEHEGVGAASFTVVRYELDGAHPLAVQLRHAHVPERVVAYGVVTALQGLAAVLAAITLGESAVTGVIDVGRVVAWSMLAASNVPLQYIASRLLGAVSLDLAGALKKRLLQGALIIHDTEIRKQGIGAQLARLNEASVVEQANVADLVGVLAPAGQLLAAFILFAKGALSGVLIPLCSVFVAGRVALGVALYRRYRACYATRLTLTQDLVEKIVGHRTRAVQANPEHMHDEEDLALRAYADEKASLNVMTTLSDVYGRLWLFAAGMALLLTFAVGARVPLLPSAIGIFLVYASLSTIQPFVERLAMWLCAWRGVQEFFVAGRSRDRPPPLDARTPEGPLDTVVSSLSFRYRETGHAVLDNATVRIKAGERILIEGPSGGGKSTLAKLLTAELRATEGTILVGGVDAFSVSEKDWRRRVASSPQFHENYIFSNTMGFNVDPKALDGEMAAEARRVCHELGLGDLLRKMPSRGAQILGETGWQLSHGERSRVFIARSLLQGAELLIFDESFGALDPESLEVALECVRRRARTLVVIAHQ